MFGAKGITLLDSQVNTRFLLLGDTSKALWPCFCAVLGGGANAGRLSNLICCKFNFCVLLCLFVNFMAVFHGSISDGWSGSAHFTRWVLFICLCVPELTRLQCCVCVTKQFPCFNTAQLGIVDSWRIWSSGWQLGLTKGQSFSKLGATAGLLVQWRHSTLCELFCFLKPLEMAHKLSIVEVYDYNKPSFKAISQSRFGPQATTWRPLDYNKQVTGS